eukprot:TRINITY_DN37616_c0_g1_i2.p1 TRINITY_DN37616_c0_g1~~TRINITY_DN37616_c0_g1_i2.p1  ORF type:complete len:387 (+),score=80.55 TRINITY_DN37616_c0_g1_i2:87-1247(+)
MSMPCARACNSPEQLNLMANSQAEKRHADVPRRVDLAKLFNNSNTDQALEVTTLMIRNVPNQYDREHFMQELDFLGFHDCYDLVYLPVDRQRQWNVGYAFVNFTSPSDAQRCIEVMDGHMFRKYEETHHQRHALVSIAHLQGLEANLAHFRDKAVFSHAPGPLRPWVRPGRISEGCEVAPYSTSTVDMMFWGGPAFHELHRELCTDGFSFRNYIEEPLDQSDADVTSPEWYSDERHFTLFEDLQTIPLPQEGMWPLPVMWTGVPFLCPGFEQEHFVTAPPGLAASEQLPFLAPLAIPVVCLQAGMELMPVPSQSPAQAEFATSADADARDQEVAEVEESGGVDEEAFSDGTSSDADFPTFRKSKSLPEMRSNILAGSLLEDGGLWL